MNFARKVIVPVNMDNNLGEVLKPLRGLEFLNRCEIQLVHVFQTTNMAYGFGEYSLIFPLETDRKKFEESVVSTLSKVSSELFPLNFQGKVISKCLFSEDPKDTFCKYVTEEKADLIIVPARKKHGWYESSFAQFVTKHTEANILILKNNS